MNQWNAGKLLALSGKYWLTCTLHAGMKLDVFSAIQNESVRADELAKRLGVDSSWPRDSAGCPFRHGTFVQI